MAFRALACAEFPNDNPGLHAGAIWYGAELAGPPACERPPVAPPPAPPEPLDAAAEPPTDPAPPVLEADDESDDIEIVDDLPIEGAIDESPAPPEAPVDPAADPQADPAVDPDAAPEIAAEEIAAEAPAPTMDPFATFVALVEQVAQEAGASLEAMALLGTILGRARLGASATDETKAMRAQALAWQAILRGESEDFSACGNGMLDEWTAALVAHVLQNTQRADGLKRELRRRGVAAFGLVDQAA